MKVTAEDILKLIDARISGCNQGYEDAEDNEERAYFEGGSDFLGLLRKNIKEGAIL